jgi:hypothetical protein
MLAKHGPPPAARSCSAVPVIAPGLLAGHGPLHAARGLAAVAAPGLSAGHRPLRATRSRDPTAVVKLRWTCGLDSSAGGQQQTAYSWRRCSH